MLKRQKNKISSKDMEQLKKKVEVINKTKEKGTTTQNSIPYKRMYKNGICKSDDGRYSKTLEFKDINYHISKEEDKQSIFTNWCDFYNYLDHSVSVQLTFLNRENKNNKEKDINISEQNDKFNSIRKEYSNMLVNQSTKGNNAISRNKYITFSIHAENIDVAKARLEKIELNIRNKLRKSNIKSKALNGKERLELFNKVLTSSNDKFNFNWDWLAPTGLGTKDFIAPSSFEFKEKQHFLVENKIGTVSFLQILAPELNDRVLSDFISIEGDSVISMHIKAIDQVNAIKRVKRKLTDLQQMKIDEQKKAVRSGYDMDILPTDLATYGEEANKILSDLQSRNERMFLVTFLTMNTARSKKNLDNLLLQVKGVANSHNSRIVRLDYMQEQGIMSSLPLAQNLIPIERSLTTSSLGIFIPFTTQELFSDSKEALYYGLNTLSDNLIMLDRKELKNPNGLILGTPGSGKSFSAKREITNVFLMTQDDIIICDPEAEYAPLVDKFDGQVIKISPTSEHYINPLDINLNYSEDDNPLALKSDFVLSLCELVVGGKDGLTPIEKSIIDRCVNILYREYFADPVPNKMPILEDLYNLLGKQEESEAKHIQSALELYVTGSLNVFNHQTNVDIQNRIVCFDIKELGKQLKKLGMLVVQDQVWNRVTVNRAEKKSTRYYMDEFHLLLKEEQTASYSVEIWKRFRKWGGIPTAITQNVKDLLASREVENIFENSDFVYMLNQAQGDKEILANQLNISEEELTYLTGSEAGEGLICYGNVILPFNDKFPQDTELYKIMTTKLSEMV